jgi:hypothetical protein
LTDFPAIYKLGDEEIMIQPEIKSILCHDLEYGKEPPDSEDCSVFIGEKRKRGTLPIFCQLIEIELGATKRPAASSI